MKLNSFDYVGDSLFIRIKRGYIDYAMFRFTSTKPTKNSTIGSYCSIDFFSFSTGLHFEKN